MNCTRGSYCTEGSSTPIPCPGGTYNNRTGQSSVSQCVEVTNGFWAPLGSALPEECPSSGFYCPGAAGDEVNAVPGSKPIIQETGGSTEDVVTPVVETTIELDITPEEFAANEDAMIEALAAQYGVDASLITLDAVSAVRRRRRQLQSAGGLLLTITIALPPSPPPSSSSSAATPISTTASLISQLNVQSLSGSLGVNVTIASVPRTSTIVQTRVIECPAGKWCTAGLVVDCPLNTYNNESGQDFATACKQCPSDSTTATVGAASIVECVCTTGYYTTTDDGLVHGEGDCAECPPGTLCTTSGQRRSSLPVEAGFWRISNTSVDVKPCPVAAGCIGGSEAAACADSLTGPYCILCTGGLGFYYNDDTESCVECTTTNNYAMVIIMAGGMFAFGIVAGILMLYCSLPAAKACSPKRRHLLWAWEMMRVAMVKAKIALSFYQVASLIPAVYKVTLPKQVDRWLSYFRVAIEIDAWGVRLSCLGYNSLYMQIVFLMTWPVFAICFTPLVGLITSLMLKQTTLKKLFAKGFERGEYGLIDTVLLRYAMPLTMLLLFVAFPPITALAFRTYEECDTFEEDVSDASSAFLISASKHYAVPCPSAELDQAQEIALVASTPRSFERVPPPPTHPL